MWRDLSFMTACQTLRSMSLREGWWFRHLRPRRYRRALRAVQKRNGLCLTRMVRDWKLREEAEQEAADLAVIDDFMEERRVYH